MKFGLKCILLLFVAVILVVSCQGSKLVKLATAGSSASSSFQNELAFRYVNQHLFIDVEMNGKTYNFLFDTGWEVTSIDKRLINDIALRDKVKGKAAGSSFDKQTVKYGYIDQISISSFVLYDIGVGVHDFNFINKHYSEESRVDGIIGTNILSHANWQIDYQKQVIRFTDDFKKFDLGSHADTIQLMPRNKSGWGLKKITVNLDGYGTPFVFDTGSSGAFTMNKSHMDSLSRIKSKANFEATGTEGKGLFLTRIDKLLLDNMSLADQTVRFEPKVSSLIGNGFLENYLVSFNWKENLLVLSSQK